MRKDLSGQRFGRLVVVNYHPELQKWECRCDCGNTTMVKASNLHNGHVKSCGCLAKETSAKNGQKGLIDLTGRRFGKLVVIKYLPDIKKWQCKCDCGNICCVKQNNLCRKNKGTKSCGCLVALDKANAKNLAYGTNIGNIRNETPTSKSTTGVRGVYYYKDRGIYLAAIVFQRKCYNLCWSENIEKCIAARKEAEKYIHGNFLEWYDSLKEEKEKIE